MHSVTTTWGLEPLLEIQRKTTIQGLPHLAEYYARMVVQVAEAPHMCPILHGDDLHTPTQLIPFP